LVKKKRIKISKEKVYLIDGLFSSTNMSSNKPNKKSNQTREIKKLRSSQNNTSSLNNLNSHKKKEYLYKCENVHDNKVNTFYMSRLNQKNQKKQGGAQEKNENPFAYNFYKANKDINSNIAGLYDYKNKIKELMKEEPKKN